LRQARDQAQQSRLARSGTAEETDDLALIERQFDTVEHEMLAAVGARERLTQAMNIEQSGGHAILTRAGICVRRSSTADARTSD
jgi:hypothetical protein